MQFRQAATFLSVLGCLALSACAPATDTPTNTGNTTTSGGVVSSPPSPPTGAFPDMTAASCPAKELQYLVGQPRTVLHTMRFGTEVRIEEPGDAIEKDYSASRTRILIGTNGAIKSVVCG
jgi:hypothetical protein